MKIRAGKYDEIVRVALSKRVPVARALRAAGFTEKHVRSCQGMLRAIRGRVMEEDAWQQRKLACYRARRHAALERLETGKSHSEAGDVNLIETLDRLLRSLQPHKNEPKEALGVIVDLAS